MSIRDARSGCSPRGRRWVDAQSVDARSMAAQSVAAQNVAAQNVAAQSVAVQSVAAQIVAALWICPACDGEIPFPKTACERCAIVGTRPPSASRTISLVCAALAVLGVVLAIGGLG